LECNKTSQYDFKKVKKRNIAEQCFRIEPNASSFCVRLPGVFSLSPFFYWYEFTSFVNQQFEFGATCDYSITRFFSDTSPPPLPKRFPNPVPIPCLVPLILTGVPKFNSNTAFSKNSQLRRSSLNYLYFYLDIGINLQPDSISLSHNHSSLYKPIWFEAKPPVTLRGILTQVSYR
jgi:hypothetical protein